MNRLPGSDGWASPRLCGFLRHPIDPGPAGPEHGAWRAEEWLARPEHLRDAAPTPAVHPSEPVGAADPPSLRRRSRRARSWERRPVAADWTTRAVPGYAGAVTDPAPPSALGATLRLARRARGLKQSHVAELLGVTQPTVSRIERGELVPVGRLRRNLLDLVAARLDPAREAALRRLVEGAAGPVHLVCDLTHRLLAASPAREREWRRDSAGLNGATLWPFATPAIRAAEARLPEIGWGERDGAHGFAFTTEGNGSPELRILPGRLVWERILLSDGAPARLVSTLVEQEVQPAPG